MTPETLTPVPTEKESASADRRRAEVLRLIKRFFLFLKSEEHSFLLADQVAQQIDRFIEKEAPREDEALAAFKKLFRGCQEAVLFPDYGYAFLRPRIGVKNFHRIHPEAAEFERISEGEYLLAKDQYVQGVETASKRVSSSISPPSSPPFPKSSIRVRWEPGWPF